MLLSSADRDLSRRERLRMGLGHRATGVGLALLLEALLVLLLLTLGRSATFKEASAPALTTFDVSSPPEEAATPEEPTPEPEPSPEPSPEAAPQPREPAPQEPPPRPQPTTPVPLPPPAILPLPRAQTPAANVAPPPRRPAPAASPGSSSQPAYGPPNTGSPGPPDTARVGTAPDGQPLYAARWYRAPYPDELTGYLSTASSPGWGLIACRTAPDWRVEDCVALGESPRGSNIARSVLAAAWQFKVRPPSLGGKSLVGAWVRIRIDYGLQQPPQ